MKAGRSGNPAVRESDETRPNYRVLLAAAPKRTPPAADLLPRELRRLAMFPGTAWSFWVWDVVVCARARINWNQMPSKAESSRLTSLR